MSQEAAKRPKTYKSPLLNMNKYPSHILKRIQQPVKKKWAFAYIGDAEAEVDDGKNVHINEKSAEQSKEVIININNEKEIAEIKQDDEESREK